MARSCPLCENQPLRPMRAAEVEVDTCPRCHGVWFDRGELERFPDRPSVRAILEAARDAPSRCRCPACGEPLARVVTRACPVDVCIVCEGVWLEAGGFEQLEGVTDLRLAPGPATHAMRCLHCARELSLQEAYAYEGDVYCGLCRPPGASTVSVPAARGSRTG